MSSQDPIGRFKDGKLRVSAQICRAAPECRPAAAAQLPESPFGTRRQPTTSHLKVAVGASCCCSRAAPAYVRLARAARFRSSAQRSGPARKERRRHSFDEGRHCLRRQMLKSSAAVNFAYPLGSHRARLVGRRASCRGGGCHGSADWIVLIASVLVMAASRLQF